jgi:protoporphyrinogen oxidase
VFGGGVLYSVSNALEFLRFPPLAIVDRLRIGVTILRAASMRDPAAIERIPVERWLRRWSGNAAFERFWRPLLRSKLGEGYVDTPATFIWATIARLYAARRSGLREERFGYAAGGYRTILGRFEAYLRDVGVEIRTRAAVHSIGRRGDGMLAVRSAAGEDVFDRVAVTAPAPVAAKLCADLRASELERLRDTRYLGIVCASLLLTDSLSPFYTTNLTDDGFPFTGIIEMSAFVDKDEFKGNSLVYLPKYTMPGDPIFDEDDENIRRRFVEGLQRVHPQLREENILAFRLSKVPYVFALPSLKDRGPIPMQTSVMGLFIVNSAQIVHGTLNVNETLALAARAAPVVLGAR